jgi:hypothetical protein
MDPYLEHPALWPDVHNRLLAELGNRLGPLLRPRYYIRIEERVYLAEPEALVFVGRPDLTIERRGGGPALEADRAPAGAAVLVEVPVGDTVRETYLEVRAVAGGEVLTVLEALSPANKVAGRGRALYEEKRRAVLATSTTGDSPVTVTDSSSTPMRISTLSVAVKSVGSSRPSRMNMLKPARLNVTR